MSRNFGLPAWGAVREIETRWPDLSGKCWTYKDHGLGPHMGEANGIDAPVCQWYTWPNKAQIAKGYAIRDWAWANWDRLGCAYMIWDKMYSEGPGHWVEYFPDYDNPNASKVPLTIDHRDHVHLQIKVGHVYRPPKGEAPIDGGKENPIWGIDVSSFQQGIDMRQVKAEGYDFCVVKATEGPYRDGTTYLNPAYREQIVNAKEAGMVVGAYHYLIETPAKAQVDLFLKTVGDITGKMLMVDYEEYAEPYGYLSPTERTLREFVAELKRRVGKHPVLLYSGQGYWESHPANGPATDMGVVTWDASYPYHPEAGLGSTFYFRALNDGYGWGKRWGDQEPMIWQFSCNVICAGMQVDGNAFRGTKEELLALTGGEPQPKPQPAPSPPVPPTLKERVDALEKWKKKIETRLG